MEVGDVYIRNDNTLIVSKYLIIITKITEEDIYYRVMTSHDTHVISYFRKENFPYYFEKVTYDR